MTRTKQHAGRSTGGKAPRGRYRTIHDRKMGLPIKGRVRKPYRFRPGTQALRQIHIRDHFTHEAPFQKQYFL